MYPFEKVKLGRFKLFIFFICFAFAAIFKPIEGNKVINDSLMGLVNTERNKIKNTRGKLRQ